MTRGWFKRIKSILTLGGIGAAFTRLGRRRLDHALSGIASGYLMGDPGACERTSVCHLLRGILIAAWNGRNNGALRPDTISELSDEQFTQLRTVLEDLRPL